MNFLDAFVFGVVEGITEFLPISSTAHLEITQTILNIPTSEFVKSFQITIQLGAILAVLWLFRKKILSAPILYLQKVLIAFIPTGVVGFILYKVIKSFLLGNLWIVVTTLFVGGCAIIFFEKTMKNNQENSDRNFDSLTNRELLIMGFSQSLAVIPGVSRSLAVILSGRLMGVPKNLVTEFSFLLAIPTMFSATIYDLYKSGFAFSSGDWANLLVGFVVAFVVALFTVKWLIGYIQEHSFSFFGYYRIFLSIILLLLLIL